MKLEFVIRGQRDKRLQWFGQAPPQKIRKIIPIRALEL